MCGKTISNLHELNDYLKKHRNSLDLIKDLIKMPFKLRPMGNFGLPKDYKVVGKLNDGGKTVLISNVREKCNKNYKGYLVDEAMYFYYFGYSELFKIENSRQEDVFYV